MSQHRSEFDEYAKDYHAQHEEKIRLSGESPEYFSEYKIAQARRVAPRASIEMAQNVETPVLSENKPIN